MTKSIKYVAVGYSKDGFDIIEAGYDRQACLDAMAKAKGVSRTELIDARGHVCKKIHFEVVKDSLTTVKDEPVDEPVEEKRGRGRPKKSD
jgi:hypothetical protein